MTIQDKLTLLIAVFGLSLIVILSALFYNEMWKEMEATHQVQLQTVVDSRVMALRHILDLRSEQTRHIANTWLPGQLSPDGKNPEELIDRLQQHITLILKGHRGTYQEQPITRESMPPIERITITDVTGRVIASSCPHAIGEDLPNWMLYGVRDRGTWYGGIHYDPVTSRDYLLFMEPIYHSESGRFTGIVSIRVGLEVFHQVMMNPFGLGETGEILMVQPGPEEGSVRFISPLRFSLADGGNGHSDRKGLGEIFSLDSTRSSEDVHPMELSAPIFSPMSGESGFGMVRDYRGELVCAVWRWLPELDIGLIGKIDSAELYAPVYQIRNMVVIVGIVILLVSLLLSWIMARSFSRPIGELAKVFSQISQGELVEPVLQKRTDEIGLLAESANRSIDYLKRVKEHVGEIAAGNTEATIHKVSEKDELSKAIQQMTDNLQSYRSRIEALLRESRAQTRQLKQQRERIIRDIDTRKELERRVIQIGDDERRRIGRDLHDGLGQMLTGIRMVSENLAKRLMANELPGALEVKEIAEMVMEADEYSRSLSRGMAQVDIESNGISMALENLCRNVEKMFGVECDCRISGSVHLKNHSVALAIYRIIQESITNAVRHGKCSKVEVQLIQNAHSILLHVDDDGKGLPDDWKKGQGQGIEIMKYRAGILGGSVEVFRVGSSGTRMQCTLPLSDLEEQERHQANNQESLQFTQQAE